MTVPTEDDLEQWVLEELAVLGWATVHGPDIAPGDLGAERADYREAILEGRLAAAVTRINPQLPPEAVADVVATVKRSESPAIESENWRAYKFLIQGVPVEYRHDDGTTKSARAFLVDWENPSANDLAAINQFTIQGPKYTRRPDVLLFVNGLPMVLFELKRAGKANATIKGAYRQTQTYRNQVPELFKWNQVTVVSDGVEALAGSFSAPWNHWAEWKTIDGTTRDPVDGEGRRIPPVEVLTRGMFTPTVFFDLVRNFVATFGEGTDTRKAVAKYHQYWAVNKAVASTLEAVETDGRIGVVWHTQGSGKSLEMAYYAGKIMRHPGMENPTVIVLTDRNDLDDQLLDETFAPSKPGSPLPEEPVQADSRENLKTLLRGRESGGIIFTTIQKFGLTKEDREAGRSFPTLSERHNIVVMVDEAHRSNYGLLDGFARNMREALPNASFIGFTGTPIDEKDRSTAEVFGEYIDIYDMTQSIKDGVTVKVFYEPRLARVALPEEARSEIDSEFEESISATTEDEIAETLKSRFSRVEAIVGAESRLKQLAADIVEHWEGRRAALQGKGMIVAMSRRVAVDLYDQIIALRPDWHDDDDSKGKIKVIITGDATDPQRLQRHIRNNQARRALKDRACDPNDPLELVIVRDMWLTGFDSPSMHTMYVDKPMQDAGLMQAITRVNRTFKDKPSGLVVDYIGIADNLNKALATYTDRDKRDRAIGEDVRKSAIPEMLAEHSIVSDMLHEVDWVTTLSGGDTRAFIYAVTEVVDYLLEQHREHADTTRGADGEFDETTDRTPSVKKRFIAHTRRLKQLFALVPTSAEAKAITDDVAFFGAVNDAIAKLETSDRSDGDDPELDTAVRQIVSQHVSGSGVIDIFGESGLERPDISVIDDEFRRKFETSNRKNLQLEAVRRLIETEVKAIRKRNVVTGRKFSEMLSAAMNRYQNRSITAAEVMLEIVELAKAIREQRDRGAQLGLNENEIAFYDALADNESAQQVMQDETMKKIAQELAGIVRQDAKTDWHMKETVRAKLRTRIKRLLLRYGYPPDQEATATDLILRQAEVMAEVGED